MERFIVSSFSAFDNVVVNLKSSMERFIVGGEFKYFDGFVFKIQYGEIYRLYERLTSGKSQSFKIQYGEIYRLTQGESCNKLIQFKIQYGEIYSVYLC